MYRSTKNHNTKHSFSLLLLLSFSILVSACSNPTNSSVSNGNPPSGPDNASKQASQERVLQDALGNEVKVPAEPERVIATYLEDHLVALGVRPVAQWSVKEGNVQDYLQGALEGVPTIPFDLPYEAVMSFQPDLIIVDSAEMVAGDKYAQYAKIAPTYAVGSEENIDWRQELLAVGEVLNKSEEARQALDNYDLKAAEAKDKLQQAVGQQSAAALWVTAKSVFVVNENLSSGDVLYHDLGLTVPEVVQEISATGSANWNAISMEKLAELDADHLFIVNSRGISKEEILNDPVWRGIPAVKKGQVYEYGMKASWLYTGTIANEQIIDNVLDSLLQ